jgi:hypothetical protein
MADYTQEIIGFVQSEKQGYEDSSSEMREIIKKARQNYAGKFLNPYTATGRKKIFVPMTRWEVDSIVPKVAVTDKAITVLPENEGSVRSALIAEKTLKHQINETRFPTAFRNAMYDLGIDGTFVFACFWNFEREVIEPQGLSEKFKKMFGKGSKPQVNVLQDTIGFNQIDILNCWIDPTADDIQSSPSFIVRNILSLDKVKRNKLYNNTDKITGFKISPTDSKDASSTRIWDIGKQDVQYQVKMTAVYERWGRIPLYWITGKKKDEKSGVQVDGVVTIADLDGNPTLLRVDKNPFHHGQKPFTECWYQKKKGRWYGIGIGEKTIDMQTYMNKTVNRREENEDVLHSSLFVVKRGSMVSAKSIRSTPGGIIEADDVNDIRQLEIRDISSLSGNTVNLINQMVQRINGASEISLGSSADRSATTSIIKDRNADVRFAAVRGYVNDFLIRFFKQWVALDRQFIDRKFILRVTGEDVDFDEIDDVLGTPEAVRKKTPNFRFIDVDPKTIRGDYDLEVDIDASIPQNKAEQGQRILQGIQLGRELQIPRNFEAMYDAYLDSLGLSGAKFKTRVEPPAPIEPQGQPQTDAAPGPLPNELAQFQVANNLQQEGQGFQPNVLV